MGLSNKGIILLNFKYQTYLTYISVIWTVAISFFIAILSYIFTLVSNLNKNVYLLIILILILIFLEIAFISVYFWINSKKEGLEKIIKDS